MNKNGEIIFVEDDLDDQEVFQQAYQDLGIPNRLVMFSDAQKAYEYFNNTKKDLFLIISDINMPIMNGIEVLETLKTDIDFKKIPIVVFTTSSGHREKLLCDGYGVELITKPNRVAEFKKVLAHLLVRCIT